MVLYYTGSSLVWDYAPGSVINYTFLNVSSATLANYTSTYQKVANIGTVSKLQASSRLKVTYYGRIKVNSVTGTGGYFELRVDDAATTNGRANANFRADEVGYTGGVTVCISGVFTGLSAGTRTISMWVRASGSGTGTGAQINPGSWAGDYIIVEEIK
ncbi:MAG TPA: hypothetical protein DDW27_17795 [Bacteroidales bacterium]|nr:hypothetical protein [Bacteroidales bacterium]